MKDTSIHYGFSQFPGPAWLLTLALYCLTFTSNAQASGTLDQTFNTSGYVWNGLIWDDYTHGIAVASNGIIYTVGHTSNSLFRQVYVTSYNSNGSVNTNFNGNGKKIFHFGNGSFSRGYDICVQSDGKILVVGEHAIDNSLSSIRKIGLARLNPNGSFDLDFSQDGLMTVSIYNDNSSSSYGRKIKVNNSNHIYAYGIKQSNQVYNASAIKLFPDGTLDPSFCSNGSCVWYDAIHFDPAIIQALDFDIQPDGKIVILGGYQCAQVNCTNSYYWIGRKFPNGNPDASMNSIPPHNIFIQGETTEWNNGVGALAIQQDGKYIIAGRTKGNNGRSLGFVSRCLPNGDIDQTFGTLGKVYLSAPGNGDLSFSDIQIQSDEKIVLLGTSSSTNNSSDGVYIQRLLSNGAVDNSFSFDGNVIINIPTSQFTDGRAMNIQPDGKILSCGDATATDGLRDSYIMRINPGPSTVGIDETLEMVVGLSVHPNPIIDGCTVTFSITDPMELSIELNDLQGRVVMKNDHQWDLSPGEHKLPIALPADLAPGTYLLVLSSPKGRMAIQVVK